jgi:hypothetical protein
LDLAAEESRRDFKAPEIAPESHAKAFPLNENV